jgi:hypothetical protein
MQEGLEIVRQSRVFVEYMLKSFDYVSPRTTTLILNMFAVLAIIDFESHRFVQILASLLSSLLVDINKFNLVADVIGSGDLIRNLTKVEIKNVSFFFCLI